MKLFRRVILVLHIIAIAALVLSVSSQWINPRNLWIPAFLGIGFPVVILINLLFVIVWIIARKRWWWLSVFAVLLAVLFATRYVALRPFVSNHLDRGMRLLTYNVQNFDLYNWKHNTESRDSIIALVKRQDPDIVCFQEFYQEDGGFMTAVSLSRELGLPYYRFEKAMTLRGKDHWGLATFSRYPIRASQFTAFQGTRLNGLLRTDIEIDSTVVRVFNTHLQSIRFSGDEFSNLNDDYARSSRRIAGKIRQGFRARADQAKRLAEQVEESPYPVVVCGDFNDPPVSYTYRTISAGLKDAFTKKGFGIGTTYAGSLPGLRIDYVLLSRSLHINGYKRLKRKLSDHYPIVVAFEF